MSFLSGGPECSTGPNPLAQFQKVTQNDQTLQRDRLVGRGGGLAEGMRSNMTANGSSDGMMDEFVKQPAYFSQQQASPIAMEQLRREFEQQHHPSAGRQWAGEFDPGREEIVFQNNAFNTGELERYAHMRQAEASQRTASPLQNGVSGYAPPMGMGMYGRMGYGGGMGMGMMQQPFMQSQPQQMEMRGKGKERAVELDDTDWEQQFKQLEMDDDQDEQARLAAEEELNRIDRSVLPDYDHFGDFESLWRGIQAEQAERELGESEEWNEHSGEFGDWDNFDGNLNAHLRDPQLGDYLFEDENVFSNLTDPFVEGVRIMDEGGNLSVAALAFEAAVQKNPQHIEAWTRLGAAQAQNEKETPAIRALEQAIKLDPANLEALMGLAVSYTNEGYDSTAYRTLERWLTTKYPQFHSERPHSAADAAMNGDPYAYELGFTDRAILQERVTDLFIRAAQLAPSPEAMDPDVQVGLGVLFYGAEEYDKAVDCFNSALTSSEAGSTVSAKSNQRPLLWNRLGATLANSGRSEEAIQAYEKALELNPNFVRARYNLGVSCINIGCYEEAAQHLLGALAMHAVAAKESKEKARELIGGDAGPGGVTDGELDRILSQNQSTNLYDTLRRVFGQMGRKDLADKVMSGVDVDIFRRDFEF